ncbi:hypothetical protein Sjap_023944 [Stephania japonica]|uniref:Uncharacterized protein n=1 Tax=Stephania japonica TaxID=461633 RepID=A0AAP0EHB6_9MAGN
MDSTGTILRRSVHTFLKNYQFYTFVPASLALPFSLSILISHDFFSSSSSPPLLPAINTRLQTLFEAAGFPTYSRLFSLFTLKLSQTLSSSILTLPFTLSFLLIAKAYVIQSMHHQSPPSSLPRRLPSITPLYSPILSTYISNSIIILGANSSILFSLFLACTALGAFRSWSAYYLLFGSTVGAILFALVLAKAIIVCNLALIVSGMEKHCNSFSAISRSLELMRGWSSTGLVLAITCNFALAAVEALFQYRVVRPRNANSSGYSPFYATCEGLLIAYLYSIVIVVDAIASCMFYKSCRSSSSRMDHMRCRRHYDCEIAEEEEDASYEDYVVDSIK